MNKVWNLGRSTGEQRAQRSPLSRRQPRPRLPLNQLLFVGLPMLVVFATAFVDIRLPVLAVMALLVAPLLLRDGLWAYYLTLPILIVFHNLGLSLPFPFLSSPTDLLVTLGVGVGILQMVACRRPLPKTPLYYPMIVFILIAILQVALIHSGAAVYQTAFEKVIRGMWPFALIILLLRTPRQARYTLVALLGTMLLAVIVWLPGLLWAAVAGDITLLRATSITFAPDANPALSWSLTQGLRTYLFVVPVSTLISIPMALFVLVPYRRIWSLSAAVLIVMFVVSSSIASGFISLFVSIVVLLAVLIWVRQPPRRRERGIFMLLPALVATMIIAFWLSLQNVPIASQTIYRVLNVSQDASGSARLYVLREAYDVFLASPLFGSEGDHWYGGHDSIVTYAANWGLAFSLPYLGALGMALLGFMRLITRCKRTVEQALLIGMFAAISANIAVSLATPNVLELIADTVVWSMVGLMVVWTSWVDRDPQALLIA